MEEWVKKFDIESINLITEEYVTGLLDLRYDAWKIRDGTLERHYISFMGLGVVIGASRSQTRQLVSKLPAVQKTILRMFLFLVRNIVFLNV